MKRFFLNKIVAAFIGLAMAGLSAQAQNGVAGEISFSGGATLDFSLNSATSFTSIFGPGGQGTGGPQVNAGATGSYQGVTEGTPVNFTPFSFNPAPVSAFQLWSFSAGGIDYSFDVTSVAIQYQDSSFLLIGGSGVARVTGLQPTAATWSITDDGLSGPVYSFGNVVVVPEPSAAAFLVVFGVAAAVSRRFRSNR